MAEGKKRIRIQWREVLTFAMFVVLAALIWYGHAMQSMRNTRVPITVQYTGSNGNIAFGECLPETIMVFVPPHVMQVVVCMDAIQHVMHVKLNPTAWKLTIWEIACSI